jgi:nanoRNase/pAp phosphatase (c-di-AMP/oligoRNAs hydrolase)
MTVAQCDLSRSTRKLEELAAALTGARAGGLLILCHNNPDPDSIASGFALQFLLHKKFGVRSVLGHGGVVTRAENKAMIQRLRIKMTQLTRLKQSDYFGIALMDTQPSFGNNLFYGRTMRPDIVIDHHPIRRTSTKTHFHDIRPDYGATSTIITEYLMAAGLTPPRSVANALLYGIKTDTNFLVRGASKSDFLAFKYLFPFTNPRVIGRIEKPCLSVGYFDDYHRGLANATLYRDVAVSWLGSIHSEGIVPELADLLLRVEGVAWSLCMGETDGLMLVSLRSKSRSYEAGKVIRRLVGKSGSAGGHRDMAGGQVPLGPLSSDERQELPRKLAARLLKIIDREGARARPMVQECNHREG